MEMEVMGKIGCAIDNAFTILMALMGGDGGISPYD